MHGNNVSIQGNITRDAEVATTAGGSNIVSFGLAWNQSKKSQNGGYEEVPSFFECKFWATDAQLRVVLDQIAKGATCAITEGHIVQERWEDKQGNSRSRVVVFVDDPIKGLCVRPRGGTGNTGAVRAQDGAYQARGNGGAYGGNADAYRAQAAGGAGAYGGNAYEGDAVPLSVYDQDIPF